MPNSPPTKSVCPSCGSDDPRVHQTSDLARYAKADLGDCPDPFHHPTQSEPSEYVTVEVISGPEGPCLAIDNTRVAGPKPWGGGRVIHAFRVRKDRLHA